MQPILSAFTVIQRCQAVSCRPMHDSNTAETWKRALAILHESKLLFVQSILSVTNGHLRFVSGNRLPCRDLMTKLDPENRTLRRQKEFSGLRGQRIQESGTVQRRDSRVRRYALKCTLFVLLCGPVTTMPRYTDRSWRRRSQTQSMS
jgi:hypothetical protein